MPSSHCNWNKLQNTSAESSVTLRAFLRVKIFYSHMSCTYDQKKATQHLLPKFTIVSVPDLITFLESHPRMHLLSHRCWHLQEILGTTLTLFQCRKRDPAALNTGTTHTGVLPSLLLRIRTNFTPCIQLLMNYTTSLILHAKKEGQPATEYEDIPSS